MKRTVKILMAAVLALILAVGVICISAVAEEENEAPNLQISACNLSFDDSVYIMYALPIDSAAGAEVKMLYFNEEQESLEDYNYANAKYCESHVKVQKVFGERCYIYKNKHLNAKNMTDAVYARAYANVDGVEYYSKVLKYSILEYSYDVLGYTMEYTPTAELKELLETMLAYGAASQKYFDYNTDNLATDEYFKITVSGGHLDDMSAKGLFKDGETVTLTANGENMNHFVWYNSLGEEVHIGETYEAVVDGKNESYTVEAHRLVTMEAVAPTCTETGLTEGVRCDECGTVFSEQTVVDALGHSYNDSGVCINCNDERYWGYCGVEREDVVWRVNVDTGVLSITGNGATANSYAPWSIYADRITSVEVGEGVTDIGAYSFKDLTLLTSVSLPESLNIIRYGAFQACTSLEVVDIPENVNSISGAVFNGCTSLVSVNIPEGVAAIGNNTFYQCASLEEIVIPNSVTSIANSAFNACSALKTVVLSKNVTEIGNYAFFKCDALEALYFAGDAETFANITLGIYNTPLTDADAYYYSETQPTDNDFSYWHYVDGEIVVWESHVHTGSETWVKHLDSHQLVYSCCYAPITEVEEHRIVDGACTVCGFKPTVSVTSVEAASGDTVSILISVADNPGITGLMLSVQYNEDALGLKGAVSGDALSSLTFTAPGEMKSGCTFLWDGIEVKDEDIRDGEILTLTFDIAPDAPEGEYVVLLKVRAYDNSLTPFTLLIENGKIIVDND